MSNVQYGLAKPHLDARLWGASPTPYTVTAGQTETKTVTIPFDCKLNGLELITDGNPKFGDVVAMETQYWNPVDSKWNRYKKFCKNWAVIPNDRTRIILFPTEPKAGLRISFTYKSTGTNDVQFMINLFTFIDLQDVDTSNLQEGEDW